MASVHEQLSDQFYKWESRGRGWQVFPEPVYPEPPFKPFLGYRLSEVPAMDDGRRPTLLSSLFRKISQRQPPPVMAELEEDEPEPQILIRDSLVELQTSLPASLNIPKDAFDQLLSNLSLCREPIAFELLGLSQRVTAQFAINPADASLTRRQLQAYFPEATFQPSQRPLAETWDSCIGDQILALEFGLEREFMFPLASGKIDPFIGIIGALSELQPGELGLFQVLFQPVQHDWTASTARAVTHTDGKPLFVNQPELAAAAKDKVGRPLYAAVVRILVRTEDYERTLQIARDLAGSLRIFIHPQGNALIPLPNDEYPFENHVADVLTRQSRRSGMLLNLDELIGFVHLPSSGVRSPILEREVGKTKAAPAMVSQPRGLLLGENQHAGRSISVRLTPEQRVRHTHVIGASGKGKSTLLLNLIRQDIENGEGVALLDPHGDLVDKILEVIPPERIGDVVLVDPSDEAYSVGFNILSAHSDLEKTLLASDLVSVFRRLSTSWGDQMGSVLNNAILVFLESKQGGTLSDLRHFLIEPAYRAEVLKTVQDPELLYYWQKGFPQLTGNKSVGPVLTRLEAFLAPKPIRYMVSQPENRLDFAQIMDRGQIFLAKLSQGMLGRENSYLLGTLLLAKFQQIAMSRQAQQAAGRKDFWLYVDEFHNFITPSMAEILTGARKYRIGLTLAHQELRQLERDYEVASAVLSNTGTRICFGLGDEDARKLAPGFSFFDARDLQNLDPGQAIARVERSDSDFNLTIPRPEEPSSKEAATRREAVIAASREKYASPRSVVEAALRRSWETSQVKELPASKPAAAARPTPTPKPPPVAAEIAQSPQPPAFTPSEPPVPPVPEKKKPTVPADLGRGGAQHQAIQQRIKQAAEALDFRAIIEQQILDGQGSVDLLLERDHQIIACEISVTNTIDYEVKNVAKCLKAGFEQIVMVCMETERLQKIQSAVSGSFGSVLASKIAYFKPDEFIAHLQGMKPSRAKENQSPVMSHGYKVKRKFTNSDPHSQKNLEREAIRSIAEVIRRRSK